MRAYSRSQGKFIDVPDQQSGGSTMQSGGDMFGGSSANLKQLLLMAALSDPKNASKYSAIAQMAEPSAQDIKAQDEKKIKNQNLSEIDSAIKLLEKGKAKTGPLAGRLLKLKTDVLGTATSDQREAYQIIQKIGAEEMFKIGGKVLPAQEIARLIPFTPDITKDTKANITNLKRMRKELEDGYNKYLGDSMANTMQPNYNQEEEDEWEVY